jgi:large subunit ribosomal protein L23
MALFGLKKEKIVEKKADKAVVKKTAVATGKAQPVLGHTSTFGHMIVRPRVTEKSGNASEKHNMYTFEVRKDATKQKIASAVKELYKVSPLKVNIVNLPVKNVLVRGKRGTQSAIKKALVFLAKGDKIDIA